MKVSRTTWLIITAGILIIALAGLGMVRYQQVKELKQLNEQLTSSQTRLSGIELGKLPAQQADLETQLGEAKLQSEAAKTTFSKLAGSTMAVSTFLNVAKAKGVEVTEIKSPGPVADPLEGVTCWVTPLDATVKGDLPKVVDFLLELNDQFKTGVIKSVTTGDNVSEIQMVIYSYRGE